MDGVITNGAAGAAGGIAPVVTTTTTKKENTMTRAAFNKLPHNERNAFMSAGGKLTDD